MSRPKNPDPSPALRLLELMWGATPEAWSTLSHRDGESQDLVHAAVRTDDRDSWARWLAEHHDTDCYFRVCPMDEKPDVPFHRGGAAASIAVPALFADIDVRSPKHSASPEREEVRKLLLGLNQHHVRLSCNVNTGNGYQPYVLLDEPVDPSVAFELLARWGKQLRNLGLANDRSDLGSLMRLPGTVNTNGGAVTRLEVQKVGAYALTDLDDLLPVLEPGEMPTAPDGVAIADDVEVAEFLDRYKRCDYPRALQRAVEGIDDTVQRQNGARHPSLRLYLWQALSEAMVGAYPARQAVEEGYARWQRHVAGERRPRNELPALLRWQVPKVVARTDLAEVRARLDEVFGELKMGTGNAEASDDDTSSFDPIDLGPYLDGGVVRVTADLAVMTDGRALLHRTRLNGIHGDSTAGKSWFVEFMVRELVTAGEVVMILDLEDTPDPFVERLRQIGVADDVILTQVVFIRPQYVFTAANVARLIGHIRTRRVAHVFLETLGEAFSLEGLNEDKDVEVAPWVRRVCRRIIEETDVGMTLVDHGTKSAERPLEPSGSKRKRAAMTGTAWLMQAVTAFSRDNGGLAVLTCAKDRHGWFRRGDQVARLVMEPVDPISGKSTLRLEPAPLPGPSFDPVDVVVGVLSAALPRALTQRQAVTAVRATGRWGTDHIKELLDTAVARGLAEESRGPNRARMFKAIPPSEPE